MQLAEALFDAVMAPLETLSLRRRRRELISMATGVVLEIGAGTGANLRYFVPGDIDELHVSDLVLTSRVRDGRRSQGMSVTYHEASAERLPFADETFDWVVFTLVFCSVLHPEQGLGEVHRVLKPGGRLLFIEHVKPRSGFLRTAVEILNPAWHAFTGECNINRDTVSSILSAGFALERLRHGAGGLLVDGIARK